MARYRVEFFDSPDAECCLFGFYPSRGEAVRALLEERERWQTVTSRNAIRAGVSGIHSDQFVVQSHQGRTTVTYRIRREETELPEHRLAGEDSRSG